MLEVIVTKEGEVYNRKTLCKISFSSKEDLGTSLLSAYINWDLACRQEEMGSRRNGDQNRGETVNLCEYRDNKESSPTSLRGLKFI